MSLFYALILLNAITLFSEKNSRSGIQIDLHSLRSVAEGLGVLPNAFHRVFGDARLTAV